MPGTTKDKLGDPLLIEVPADVAIEEFVNQDFDGKSFEGYVDQLSKLAETRSFATPTLNRACGGCEYRVAAPDLHGKESGFLNCWTTATKLKTEQFNQPLIFDIWNLHFTKKDKLIADKRYFLKEVTVEDIGPEDDDSSELSAKQRQWMQVDFFQKSKANPYFDAEHFAERSKIERWRPPFHFIDFETLTSAIPFHKGILREESPRRTGRKARKF